MEDFFLLTNSQAFTTHEAHSWRFLAHSISAKVVESGSGFIRKNRPASRPNLRGQHGGAAGSLIPTVPRRAPSSIQVYAGTHASGRRNSRFFPSFARRK